jgi:LysM repeat protein
MEKYQIEKGENLISVARILGVSVTELMKENEIVKPSNYFIGQELIIPREQVILPSYPKLKMENLKDKVDTIINFLEGSKLKKQLDSTSKENIGTLLYECIELNVTDLRMVAYILATVLWETNKTFRSREEIDKGRGKTYGIPDKRTGKVYFGRGFFKLSWYVNYERFTTLLNKLGFDIDLVNKPELLLDPEIASRVLIIGMRDGKFTGRDLDDFFNLNKSDWYQARSVLDISYDKAVIIKSIAEELYYIIK